MNQSHLHMLTTINIKKKPMNTLLMYLNQIPGLTTMNIPQCPSIHMMKAAIVTNQYMKSLQLHSLTITMTSQLYHTFNTSQVQFNGVITMKNHKLTFTTRIKILALTIEMKSHLHTMKAISNMMNPQILMFIMNHPQLFGIHITNNQKLKSTTMMSQQPLIMQTMKN